MARNADASKLERLDNRPMKNQALVFTTLQAAARTAASDGHAREAEAIFRRVASLIERQLGKDTEEYAECMHELGDVCAEQKAWDAAEESYRAAMVAYRQVLSEFNPAHALVLRSLSDVLRHLGRELEARVLEKEAAEILAKRLAR